MKKEKIYKYMWVVSSILVIIFVLLLIIDYLKYDPIFTSAPFYVYIIIRALEFILPSIIFFVTGFFCKRKFTK